ncbi:MAG: DMT family transporter [Deltaproteobacteria bacterium]|nr:DMT family transporter [Deltaproteobacteria bacterium]
MRAARLALLAGALCFSTGGAAIKFCSLNGWQVASFRSGVAVLALLVLAPTGLRSMGRRDWVVGAAMAATLIAFVVANKLTSAANVIFLQSTSPFYLLVLAPWLLGEPLQRRDLAIMLAIAAGMALFFIGEQPATHSAPDPLRGNLIAAASGLSFALTLIGLRWVSRGGGTRSGMLIAGNALTFLLCLPLALPVIGASLADWLVIAWLGVVQIGFAYLLVTAGLQRVPAFEAALLLMLEPVLNPVWAALVQGEIPSPWALAGGAVILTASLARRD